MKENLLILSVWVNQDGKFGIGQLLVVLLWINNYIYKLIDLKNQNYITYL